MVFLANENFPAPSIEILRGASFVVKSIREQFPGITDEQVIALAQKNNRVILTFDRDYGELLVRFTKSNPPSVIYFRLKGKTPQFAGELLLGIIDDANLIIENNFTVIAAEGVPQRKY